MSPYKIGWIGLRVSKLGRASRILKTTGWMQLCHADLNNRNGFDWVKPCKTQGEFNAFDWAPMLSLGLAGIAIWYTDAQWKHNATVTNNQWRNRKIMEGVYQ